MASWRLQALREGLSASVLYFSARRVETVLASRKQGDPGAVRRKPPDDRAADAPVTTTTSGCDAPLLRAGLCSRVIHRVQDAERFTLNGSVLLICGKATESHLRFLRKEL